MSTETQPAKRMTRREALCVAIAAMHLAARLDSDYREKLIQAIAAIDDMLIAQARQAGRNSFAAEMVKGKSKAQARQIRKALKQNRIDYKVKFAKEPTT